MLIIKQNKIKFYNLLLLNSLLLDHLSNSTLDQNGRMIVLSYPKKGQLEKKEQDL